MHEPHRFWHRAARACAASALLLVACGDSKTSDGDAKTSNDHGGSSAASELTSCGWRAELNPPVEPGACQAARTRLRCDLPGGVTASCSSDGVSGCHDLAGTDVDASKCTRECKESEYAVSCGAVGPSNIQEPPKGCRSLGALPAGIALYCCPCLAE